MLTIAPLKQWSVRYYNDTSRAAVSAALDREKAGGGLGEYYSEGESRTPFWMCAGDVETSAALCGLSAADRAGGEANLDVVARWLDDGVAPGGACGRKFSQRANHGFDLTFCAPKSVSLLRALDTGGVASKAVVEAHNRAVAEALEYLHTHAGYTRVHNPVTGMKDLQRLPGLVAAAYQHETSRAGDPHLHTHVLVPNKQARADGTLVALDSDSLWHEAKAAGIVYQTTLRHELRAALGVEWDRIDPHSGMAELAGVDPELLAAASQRSTQLSEWAAENLVVDGSGKLTAAQLARAQKATRPRKPEHRPWAELKAEWAARFGGELVLDEAAQQQSRDRQRDEERDPGAWFHAAMKDIDKAAFTRADLIEALGGRLPVALEGNTDGVPFGPRGILEYAADQLAMRVTEARQPHEREGHERYTTVPVLREEAAIYKLIGARNLAAAVPKDVADTAVKKARLSADQAAAVGAIATSPWLIQVLSAPAGAGKTTSLRALRYAAKKGGITRVLLATPTGNAADVALAEKAADGGGTVASTLKALRDKRLVLDAQTLLVVDEAGMVGTPALHRLLAAASAAGTKTVLVGDAEQLAPVKARGGMFAQLCTDLPWAQKLTEVWRMRDLEERAASLAIHEGTPASLTQATDWYRSHRRLHVGDPVTMAHDALTAWSNDRANGVDSLLIADRWQIADALNERIHRTVVAENAPTVAGARRHRIGVGDTIITRRNDPTIGIYPRGSREPVAGAPPVRNGQRWTVTHIDTEVNRLRAVRIGDQASAVLSGDYLRAHVHHGYAVTVHAAQGATAEHCHAVLSPDTGNRAAAYVAMTRGRATNTVYLYERLGGEGDHEHAPQTVEGVHTPRRGDDDDAATALLGLLSRDNTVRTVIDTAETTAPEHLPEQVVGLLGIRERELGAARVIHDAQQLADETEWIKAASGRSPAAASGYNDTRSIDEFLADRSDLTDASRALVRTMTKEFDAVQPLRIDDRDDKPALLAAMADASRTDKRFVLAAPGTAAAREQATKYASTKNTFTADVLLGHLEKLDERGQSERARKTAGALIIVDDAEHLDAKQLQRLCEQAGKRNVKLLLVTTGTHRDRDVDTPGQAFIDTLHAHLPWARHFGDDEARSAPDTAIQRARRHRVNDPQITEILARANRSIGYLERLHKPIRMPDIGVQRSNDGYGLEL